MIGQQGNSQGGTAGRGIQGGAQQQPVAGQAVPGAVQPGQGGQGAPSAQPGTPDGGAGAGTRTLYTEKPQQGSAGQQAMDIQTLMQKRSQANESLIGIETTLPPELESFLSTPAADAAQLKTYEQTFDEISGLLRQREASKAVVRLFELSGYAWDSGISEQLGNRVLSYWDMMRNQTSLAAANKELEQQIRAASRNADFQANSIRKQEIDFMRQAGKNNLKLQQAQQKDASGNNKGGAFLPSPELAASSITGVMGKLQVVQDYFVTLDARAKTRLNEKQSLDDQKKARQNFQSNIRALFDNGRHFHAKLAADFYRVVMGDGDLPAEVAAQAATAAEIVQRIRGDAQVIVSKVQAKRLASAAQMLREDFTISRLHPALQAVPLDARMKIQDYFADLQKLQNMAEARDFAAMEKQIARLESDVVDFDATKPRAYVNAAKRESDMHLGMAKLAAQQGSVDKAMEEFKAASIAWPENPALAQASTEFFKKNDAMSQSTDEFDKAFARGDYREIFEKQLQFATAVHGSKAKEDQMRKALELVKAAEMALEKAKILEKNRDTSGAWETLELAAMEWPDDPMLNKRRADLSVRASEFVRSISNARDAESAGNSGFGLAWFLNAQQTYPPSQIANDAIERLSAQVLGKRPKITRTASGDEPTERHKTETDAPASDSARAPDRS